MDGLSRAHPEQKFLYAYRSHRLARSLGERLPPNARRAWLRSGGGIAPYHCALFHSLNQRIDGRFPRAVATFHDLFVLSGDYSTPEFRARFTAQARAAAERADLLIAVSEFTASQLTELLNVEHSRIVVVPHGADAAAGTPPPDEARENVILHVGAIQKRKNLARLVEAFEGTAAGWRLVLAGSTGGFGAAEVLSRIEASRRRADIELTGYVSAEALEALYRRARILAFPSLDEGFGMPVLDAMARGVAVLTADRSATREVAGDAAWLVDPFDEASIGAGLDVLTRDAAVRGALVEKGARRAAQFTWDRTVEKTWAVYARLL